MNADGSGLRQLTSNTCDDEEPSWSPSSKWIVFGRDFDRVRASSTRRSQRLPETSRKMQTCP